MLGASQKQPGIACNDHVQLFLAKSEVQASMSCCRALRSAAQDYCQWYKLGTRNLHNEVCLQNKTCRVLVRLGAAAQVASSTLLGFSVWILLQIGPGLGLWALLGIAQCFLSSIIPEEIPLCCQMLLMLKLCSGYHMSELDVVQRVVFHRHHGS